MAINSVDLGISKVMNYYKKHGDYKDDLVYYSGIMEEGFVDLAEEDIKSGGYVVDTLEAVVGGLTGLKYGYENIPKEWIGHIARGDYIESMCIG